MERKIDGVLLFEGESLWIIKNNRSRKRLIIDKNNVNDVDDRGDFPLRKVVRDPDFVRSYIELGADINKTHPIKGTPLKSAVNWLCVESVEILLNSGGKVEEELIDYVRDKLNLGDLSYQENIKKILDLLNISQKY